MDDPVGSAEDEAIPWDKDEEDVRALTVQRWAGVRRAAWGRVQWPGFLLVLAGGITMVYGLGLALFLSAVTKLVIVGLLLTLAGFFMVLAGHRMMQLRSYRLAMTATVLALVLGALSCAPLILLGIWPLIVLLDGDVKWAFSMKELPD